MNKSLWEKVQPHAIALGVFFVVSCIYCLPAFKGLVVNQPDAEGWKGMAQQSIEFREKWGHYPLWTNAIFSGMPAFQIIAGPTINITIAYLHHLFIVFLPEPAGLFFLSCLGFYILCMSLGIKSRIAIMASLAYAFSTYNAVIVSVGHTTKFSSMGYAPAVLAGLVLLSQRRYLLGFITTLVFSTQLFYQNHIQIVYYTFLIAICFAVVFAIQEIRTGQWQHLLKSGGLAALAAGMGFLSFAVILLPTYDYSKETMRGGRSELSAPETKADKSKGGLDKNYAFQYSYGLTEVLTIAVPRLYGGSSGELPPGSKTSKIFAEKTGMSEEQADQFAQTRLPAYWGPQGGTAGAVYFGALICILFIFGMVYYTEWNSQWILAATLVGIFLAWGKHFSTLNYFLFDHLPFYNKFRAPSMAMVIPQLTFPLMAALGLNTFLERKMEVAEFLKKFRVALIASGVFLALVAMLYFILDFKGENDNLFRDQLSASMLQQASQQGKPTPELQQQAEDFGRSVFGALKEDRRSMFADDLLRSLIFIALGLGMMYLFVKNKVKSSAVILVLIGLVFIDLIGVDLRYLSSSNYVEPESFEETLTPTAADLEISKDQGYYRVFNSTGGDPFQGSAVTNRTSYLHNSIGGYHPAKLALYEDLKKEQLEKGNMKVFNMLNTKYVIVADPSNNQQVVQTNPGALGPAWFVSNIKFVNNATEEIRALDHMDPKDSAVVEKKEQPKISLPIQADTTATIKLVENRNDQISYTSQSRTNQLGVFSEVYYPNGWSAFIDGKESPIIKVNYLLRGLVIPAGSHKIEFRFEPASYKIGNAITLVVGIISILVLLYGAFVLWKGYRASTIQPPNK